MGRKRGRGPSLDEAKWPAEDVSLAGALLQSKEIWDDGPRIGRNRGQRIEVHGYRLWNGWPTDETSVFHKRLIHDAQASTWNPPPKGDLTRLKPSECWRCGQIDRHAPWCEFRRRLEAGARRHLYYCQAVTKLAFEEVLTMETCHTTATVRVGESLFCKLHAAHPEKRYGTTQLEERK